MERRISKLPLDKENKLKEVMGGLPRRILCVFGEKKEEEECVRKNEFLCVEKMVCMEKTKCVQTNSMGGSCV